jgi:hypothetical protein
MIHLIAATLVGFVVGCSVALTLVYTSSQRGPLSEREIYLLERGRMDAKLGATSYEGATDDPYYRCGRYWKP